MSKDNIMVTQKEWDAVVDFLNKYREDTADVFFASFKGLRDDGRYRRRLDFDAAKNIMSVALESFLDI